MAKNNNYNWREKLIRDNLIKALKENPEIIVLDLETTGLDNKTDRIIQLNARRFNLLNNKLIFKDSLNVYIRPAFPITSKIENLTGITNDFIKDKPTEEAVFDKIFKYLGSSPNICGHCSNFDIGFLKELYLRYSKELTVNIELDTCVLAKEVISKYKVANYKLATIAEYYGLNKGVSFHNAEEDVKVTSQVLQVIINEFIEKYKKDEIPQPVVSKKIARIISTPKYWKGHNRFSRIYVNTNMGSVYYDVLTRKWNEKDSGTIEKIDMNNLISEVFEMLGVNNEDEFSKYRG